MLFLFYSLIVFCIIGSIIAIEAKNILASVISAGVVGMGLSILFLFLGAPDIAITQVVVEIIVLIVLIRSTVSLDNTAITKHRDTFAVLSSLIFFGLFLIFAFLAFQGLPKFGEPLMRVSSQYLQNSVSQTGASNVVMGILLDYRAFDTLGEATVIFTAILSAFVVLRAKGKKKKEEYDKIRVGIPRKEDLPAEAGEKISNSEVPLKE
jgi:multisubunit Na+/H+ antiporter MnhB subunit